jgi:hypothetical protein
MNEINTLIGFSFIPFVKAARVESASAITLKIDTFIPVV